MHSDSESKCILSNTKKNCNLIPNCVYNKKSRWGCRNRTRKKRSTIDVNTNKKKRTNKFAFPNKKKCLNKFAFPNGTNSLNSIGDYLIKNQRISSIIPFNKKSKTMVGMGAYNNVWHMTLDKTCIEYEQTVVIRSSVDPVYDKKKILTEIDIAVKMSDLKIGPLIYDVFINKTGNANIVMQFYPLTLRDLLSSSIIHKSKYQFNIIAEKCATLYDRMAAQGILCFDQKPDNILAQANSKAIVKNGIYCLNKNALDIRLIDFDFCHTKKNVSSEEIKVYSLCMLLMLNASEHHIYSTQPDIYNGYLRVDALHAITKKRFDKLSFNETKLFVKLANRKTLNFNIIALTHYNTTDLLHLINFRPKNDYIYTILNINREDHFKYRS